jgi:predicted lipid carrier protein YhbT
VSLVQRRHPDVFERLAALEDPVYLVDPVDLPFAFVLRPDPLAPSLRATRTPEAETVTATVRGPLLALIDLLEGRIDGDALFFTRTLVIEGDTEAVVALRNAVDGAEISVLDDVLALLGPFSGPARRLARRAGGLLDMASRDLETLRDAMIAPAVRRAEGQAARLARLDERVDALARGGRRARAGAAARERGS